MSGFRIVVGGTLARIILVSAIGLLAATAWLALWAEHARLHDMLHFQGPTAGLTPFVPSALLMFVVAWTVMSVAMMLPTCLPILTALHTFARERSDRALLIALAAVGYLAAWIVVGALIGPVSLAIQTMPIEKGWPSRVLAPGLLLLAGLFQFSALKYSCLEKCRSPLHFVLRYWRGAGQRWHAFQLGWASGVFCVGCCWALMLLMLLSSVGHLAWMLVLGLVMAVEKNVPWGRRLSAPVGAALIVGAVVMFVVVDEPGRVTRMALEFCGAK